MEHVVSCTQVLNVLLNNSLNSGVILIDGSLTSVRFLPVCYTNLLINFEHAHQSGIDGNSPGELNLK